MNRLTFLVAIQAVSAILLMLDFMNRIELGAMIWPVAIAAILGAFYVINERNVQEKSDG